MISFLPASLIARLQYRLDWIEVSFAVNTGLDDHKVRQFYRLRFIRSVDLQRRYELFRQYPPAVVIEIASWTVLYLLDD